MSRWILALAALTLFALLPLSAQEQKSPDDPLNGDKPAQASSVGVSHDASQQSPDVPHDTSQEPPQAAPLDPPAPRMSGMSMPDMAGMNKWSESGPMNVIETSAMKKCQRGRKDIVMKGSRRGRLS